MTNFQRNLSTGEVDVQGSVIHHLTEYRERRNHFSFYSVNVPPFAYETDRESFTGRYGGFALPEAVVRGQLSCSNASGWSPVAAFQHDFTLSPGEEKSFVFLLGYVENPPAEKWTSAGTVNVSRATAMRQRFDTVSKVDAEFAALGAYWDDLLSRYTVKSGDRKLDRMVNTWNQYQCMVTFLMARSASFFESGIGRGIGFRDTSQDLLGCMHQVPGRARQRLFDVASTQRADGGAWHQYQPLTKRGNADVGDGFNDDPLWLILGVAAYVKETGDWAFLDEQVPFDNDPSDSASLFEHLKRSFSHVVNNPGPHGLPLIGHADWNDCLNLNCFSTDPNESFQTTTSRDGRTAESVLIAGMFIVIGEDYVEICRRTGRAAEAREAESAIADMRRSRPGPRVGRGVVPARLRRRGPQGGLARVRRRQDLHRVQRLLRHGGGGSRGGSSPAGAGLGADAPGHRVRHRAPRSSVRGLPRGAGRDLLLPAGVQGKRRDLLPQQPVDHDRRVRCGTARPRIRVLPQDQPGVPGRASRSSTGWSRTCTRR